jgi:hypothetical protein
MITVERYSPLCCIAATRPNEVPLNVRAVLDIPVVKTLLLDIDLMVFPTHAPEEHRARTYLSGRR